MVVPDVSFAPSTGSRILNASACCATRPRHKAPANMPTFPRPGLRFTFHTSRLPFQVEWNIGQDNALFEQEGCLEEQRPLVVQDALPPMGGKNLRDDDGYP